MPMNKGIVVVSIIVKLRNAASPKPITPVFNIRADVQDGTPSGFQFIGGGDFGDADFLKDILRKISESYPMKPISLCTVGSRIRPDAQCPSVPASQPPDVEPLEHGLATAKNGGPRRRTAKATAPMAAADTGVARKQPTAPKKTTHKKTAGRKTAPKTTSKKTGPKRGSKRKTAKKRG